MQEFLRRASALQVGDGIRWTAISALDECEIDGERRIKMTLPHRPPTYFWPDDFVRVSSVADEKWWPPVRVGTIAIAKQNTPASLNTYEVGVCVEARFGYLFLFEQGGLGGFSPEDCREDEYLMLTEEVCEDVASYQFKDSETLERDYKKGVFKRAFSLRYDAMRGVFRSKEQSKVG